MNLPKPPFLICIAFSTVAAGGCTKEQQKLAANVLRPGELPAGEVDIVANLPTLPGATVLGLGYDPSEERVFRNRVLASDLGVARSAWVSPSQGGLFYYPETDRRYLVPREVMLLPQHQRSDVQFTIAESKAAFAKKLAVSVKASGGYGLFTASVEGSFDTSSKGENASTFAQRSERMYLWSLWLTPQQKLDGGFKARFDALPVEIDDAARAAYDALVDDFGVAVVSYAALGGRVDYNQTMAREARQSERDIKLAVSASYGTFFSASGSVASSGSNSNENSNTQTSVQVFGGNPAEAALLMEKGGDLVPWSVSVPRDPAVVEIQLIDLWKLAPPGPRRNELERAVYRHGRAQQPSVALRVVGGDVPELYLDDGTLISNSKYPEQSTAEHMRVVVIDARNLRVRDDRFFYTNAPTVTGGGAISALRASRCIGCEQCANMGEDEWFMKDWKNGVLDMLERVGSDDLEQWGLVDEQRDNCVTVLRNYKPPTAAASGGFPSTDDVKHFLAGIQPHELVVVFTVGSTGALTLRRDVIAELRALGAKADPVAGSYLLIGSPMGGASVELPTLPSSGFRALLFDDERADRYTLPLIGGVPITGE
jgi:hypothetical protein